MEAPLYSRLPQNSPSESDLLDRFLDYVREKRLELYPAQEEAILELFDGRNVILNTPTGSGKSLVATALHFHSLAMGRKSVYTSPIKALVNEKFLSLCREFGPEQVGMITGDASVNPNAPIICCTAEILAIDGLRWGSRAPVDDIIMDEFHYYSDRERGVAWQIPLLTLPQSRFLLMSATLGDTEFFEKELTRLTKRETKLVHSAHRPVPLDFRYSETPLHEQISKLINEGRAPIYLVSFTQRECAEEAQNALSVDFCTKEEKRVIADALEGVKFTSPYGKEVQRLIRHGIGIHHAGLLPKYRVLVEKLAQKGLLKIIFGTDTLGVGVNIPIRTVLLTKLCKFDGEKTALLSVRDFHQICGRAGRKGFDDLGTVVIQAPEHVIDNIRMEQKAAGDPKKLKKIVKRKPPDKGYVAWNKETFDKLISGKPEPLVSRFKVSHGMLLHVLGRESLGDDGCEAMRSLLRSCHESPHSKRRLGKTAFELFRSLVERKIIELNPLRVNVDLQEDFSINHALGLYLIDTLKLLDPQDPEYPLQVLTLVESILEDPDLILRRQLDRLKGDKIRELKEQGMEYDERMEELEKLEYPKPMREFVYQTFNEFAAKHPWVGQDNIRPKSIAREMYEMFHSFPEYIREYDLERIEGILLRYLSEVYKALVQTVPAQAKNEEIEAIEEYLRSMVRGIDSSLIDEWERLRNPAAVAAVSSEATAPAAVRPQDTRSFAIQVRNEIFRLVRALACGDYASAQAMLANAADWPAGKIEESLEPYYSERTRICTDTGARAAQFMRIEKLEGEWKIVQILVDPEELNDWVLELRLDIACSVSEGRPVLRLDRLGPL